MSQLTHVYQLLATFTDPFTGRGTMERRSTTVFPSQESAERRFETFATILRGRLKVEADYPITVSAVSMEIIY